MSHLNGLSRLRGATEHLGVSREPSPSIAPGHLSQKAQEQLKTVAVCQLDCRHLALAHYGWKLNARHEQKPPAGDWRTWLMLGGRGSGKTRAGAEWVHGIASTASVPVRFALVAETLADAREVMIDGISGIWRIASRFRPQFEITRRRLVWPNGSVAQLFSSEDPDSLRGPQFDYAWCDELAKWKHAQETWDMLQFGLRLGSHPRQMVTTTPRPVPLIRALIADSGTVVTRISTRANADNLAAGFIEAVEKRYGGTRLGRQELDGELIADREDGLWSRDMLERLRVRSPGPIGRIVVAVDPPAAEKASGSCCGIVVAGLDATGKGVVLADLSVDNASPAEWGNGVVRAFRRFQADRVVAEVNQGGDMVTAILRSIDADLPATTVRATRGKFLRAEPVAALYEQGRVAHAGTFAALEDQMCDFGPDGLSGGGSPDRLDALVWALTALMLAGHGEPRVRGV
ncbi:DNA-packaging protein [Rhizobium sp. KVB221]|uniref:DNA-packaging protein n=1 Tax=Rhizobium setariae TaxID=2801340 RepID=A0A936YMV9_9HYPH|nr:terminase family protein [Rhizobium setariae]MBL0371059.1 DNA-packaging protein [Rhizobium setariae]